MTSSVVYSQAAPDSVGPSWYLPKHYPRGRVLKPLFYKYTSPVVIEGLLQQTVPFQEKQQYKKDKKALLWKTQIPESARHL